MYQERNYIIFPVEFSPLIYFSQVKETSPDTLRISVDGTKTFVKWEGEMPSCVEHMPEKEGPYTYDEMLQIISTEEWTHLNTIGESK